MKKLATLVATMVVLSSCNSVSTGPALAESAFSADALGGKLWLINRSAAPVHFVAVEAETAIRMDLYFDPTRWPSVPAGEARAIPYREVMGYSLSARQAVVHWWTEGRYQEALVVDFGL